MPKSPAKLESRAAIAHAVQHAVKTALADVLEAQKPSQKKPNKTTIEPPPARKVKRVKAAAGLTKRVCRQSISDSWLGSLRECLAHLV